MLHGRTEIAGFQPKLYKTLQKMASKTTSYTHEINGFGVVKGEKSSCSVLFDLLLLAGRFLDRGRFLGVAVTGQHFSGSDHQIIAEPMTSYLDSRNIAIRRMKKVMGRGLRSPDATCAIVGEARNAMTNSATRAPWCRRTKLHRHHLVHRNGGHQRLGNHPALRLHRPSPLHWLSHLMDSP